MCFLEIFCTSHSSCSSWVLQIFLIFKDLWWKFFGAFKLEFDEASMEQSLLKFLVALKFDSSRTLRLGRMIWMNVLRLQKFVVKVLWSFGGLDLKSFTNL